VLGRECPQHLGLVLRDEQRGREGEQQQRRNGESNAVTTKDCPAGLEVCVEDGVIAIGPRLGPTRLADSGPCMGAPAIGMKTATGATSRAASARI
jgi:hypothetical protein